MKYTEDFKKIIGNHKEIVDAKIFILKNDRPNKMKCFPNEIGEVLIKEYFEKLKFQTSDKEFVSYIPDCIEKETLQVLPTNRVELWNRMLQAINEFSVINNPDITVDDYNKDGNTILVEIKYIDNQKVYFLNRYQRVAEWYRNSIRFKKQTGRFVKEENEILAINPYIDVVIQENRCYIINEANFNKIFKYDEVIKKQVESRKNDIMSLNFIGDTDIFISMLDKSKQGRQAMAKILLQNRLEKIKKYTPNYIRKQIEEQRQLAFIKFNDDDTIIVDKKSFKAIIDILRGKISLDLITKELNGVDRDE